MILLWTIHRINYNLVYGIDRLNRNKDIKTVRKIETELGQTYYFLDGDTVGYLRHELLKG